MLLDRTLTSARHVSARQVCGNVPWRDIGFCQLDFAIVTEVMEVRRAGWLTPYTRRSLRICASR
jgi:hypothetical protein